MSDVRLIDANAVASGVEYVVDKIEREGVDAKGVSDPFTAKLDAWALKLAAKILRDKTVAPTIDAVPVVRCKYCMNATKLCDGLPTGKVACLRLLVEMPDDGFCHNGRRWTRRRNNNE